MAGGLFSRLKNWVAGETLTYSDLNAEFNNVINNFIPAKVDDYSETVSQMQTQTSPGTPGSESQATSLSGEIERIRYVIKNLLGETYWYSSPDTTIAQIQSDLTGFISNPANRIVSGKADANNQPMFLIPTGSSNSVTIEGTPTNLVTYINGSQVTVSSDITLSGLTVSTGGTVAVNDSRLSDQEWSKYVGEGTSILNYDTASNTDITSRVGQLIGVKIDNGSASEYALAYVKSTTELTGMYRGFFFNSSDASIDRVVMSDNDVITYMKLTWVYLNNTGTTGQVSYNPPVISYSQPTSPSSGDFWFDITNSKWKKFNGTSYDDANAHLIGVCLQDGTNTVAARSFDFHRVFTETNSVKNLYLETNNIVRAATDSEISVYGTRYRFGRYNLKWDTSTDLESGVSDASSQQMHFYISDLGAPKISSKGPHYRPDLLGHYHPTKPWRWVGQGYNNSSSNIKAPVSFYDFDKIGARYFRTSSETYTSGSTTWELVNFDEKSYDFFGNVTTGSDWEFLVTVPGIYQIETSVDSDNTGVWDAGDYWNVAIEKGTASGSTTSSTVGTKVVVDGFWYATATAGNRVHGYASTETTAYPGEKFYVSIRQTSGGNVGLSLDAKTVWVKIRRVCSLD